MCTIAHHRLMILELDLLQVTDTFTISEYQAALDKMSSRGALKIAVKPN